MPQLQPDNGKINSMHIANGISYLGTFFVIERDFVVSLTCIMLALKAGEEGWERRSTNVIQHSALPVLARVLG